MSLIRLIIVLFLIGLISSIILYGYIDRKVEQRLSSAQVDVFSGVYSGAMTVVAGDKIDTQTLRAALLDRAYVESSEAPRNP